MRGFSIRKLLRPPTVLQMPSLVSFHRRWIFVSGGRGQIENLDEETLFHSSYYDTEVEEWHFAPPLNQMRYGHSSSVLGNMIYVLCGTI